MITEKEIEHIIDRFRPKDDDYSLKRLEKNGYLYFYFTPNDIDGRKAQAGGGDPRGMPIINLKEGTIEFIHYMDFPLEMEEEILIPSIDLIIEKIKRRGYINMGDVFNFCLNEFDADGLPGVDYYKVDKDVLGIKFDGNDFQNDFVSFFDKIGVEYLIKEQNKLEILREVN